MELCPMEEAAELEVKDEATFEAEVRGSCKERQPGFTGSEPCCCLIITKNPGLAIELEIRHYGRK